MQCPRSKVRLSTMTDHLAARGITNCRASVPQFQVQALYKSTRCMAQSLHRLKQFLLLRLPANVDRASTLSEPAKASEQVSRSSPSDRTVRDVFTVARGIPAETFRISKDTQYAFPQRSNLFKSARGTRHCTSTKCKQQHWRSWSNQQSTHPTCHAINEPIRPMPQC